MTILNSTISYSITPRSAPVPNPSRKKRMLENFYSSFLTYHEPASARRKHTPYKVHITTSEVVCLMNRLWNMIIRKAKNRMKPTSWSVYFFHLRPKKVKKTPRTMRTMLNTTLYFWINLVILLHDTTGHALEEVPVMTNVLLDASKVTFISCKSPGVSTAGVVVFVFELPFFPPFVFDELSLLELLFFVVFPPFVEVFDFEALFAAVLVVFPVLAASSSDEVFALPFVLVVFAVPFPLVVFAAGFPLVPFAVPEEPGFVVFPVAEEAFVVFVLVGCSLHFTSRVNL